MITVPSVILVIGVNGVGKTTSAVNIAAALGSLGKRTLLVDFDPQGNATSGLGIEKTNHETLGITMTNVILGAASLSQAIRPTKYKNFDLAPTTPELANAEVEMPSCLLAFIAVKLCCTIIAISKILLGVI